jgi:hypothetical protein
MIEKEANPAQISDDAPNFKTALEAARLYLMRWGFTSMPVESQSKKPLFKDWGNTEITEETLPNLFFDESLNVGIILGPRSGGLADVDLDCAESRALAPYLLPETGLIRGRKSAPGSGYLYTATGENAKYVETRDPILSRNERNVLVEMRTSSEGKAHMTVVPPSVHPSGEHYVWDKFGDPARISGEELTRLVYLLAAACLLVRYWPLGSRQSVVLPLAGTLYRLGWKLDKVIHFVRSVAIVANDEQVETRVDAVRSTYENAQHGQNVTGAPTLMEVLGEKRLVDRITRYLKLGSEPVDDHQLSRAQQLHSLLSDVTLFRTPSGKVFAAFYVEDHREVWPVKSLRFGSWVRHTYLKRHGGVIDSRTLDDVIALLQAEAFTAPVHPVYTRVAGFEGKIYVNLANERWEAIEATSDGWEIVADSPVFFRRPDGMLPLPSPHPEGDVGSLRSFLNIESDKDWLMTATCMAQALTPFGPYPLVLLVGEQGSAKSTTARVMRGLIDPNEAPLRMAPGREKDLMIMANNSWVLVFDNISGVKEWLSNALCCLSTGGSFSSRALYTDDGEAMFTAKRPVILTSIAEVITRSDLLDRTVLINLPAIPDESRRYEDEFWEEFRRISDQLFGGLLNLLCAALRHLPDVELKGRPRMADFARMGVAVERALGMERGLFMRTYDESRKHSVIQILESSPVARAIMLMMHKTPEWEGRASQLLKELDTMESASDSEEEWPRSPRALTNRLNELAPNLRRAGYLINRERASHGGGTIIKLRRVQGDVEADAGPEPGGISLFNRSGN